MISITPKGLLSVPPIIPSTVTLPVPDSIVKFLALASAPLIVELNETAPFPADVSIRILPVSSNAAPVIVTVPTLLLASAWVMISPFNVVTPVNPTTLNCLVLEPIPRAVILVPVTVRSSSE